MPVHIVSMTPAAPPDPRRTITEAELPTEADLGFPRITQLRVHPQLGQGPAILGRHFHRHDRERFILVDGYGVLVAQEVDPATEVLTGGTEIHLVRAGDVIVMEPFTAHTFIFDLPALMLCAPTRLFDDRDMPLAGPELPDLVSRAELCLQAETGDEGEVQAPRVDDIWFGDKICLYTAEGPSVGIGGAHTIITDANLGQVLLWVRNAVKGVPAATPA